mmetsp:Transcript_18591/g.38676  ORF Transcript_18591/g.38676 Transcript_18591/m.38676 type:complete len:184 (-) Transcript_18591:182-733(-)
MLSGAALTTSALVKVSCASGSATAATAFHALPDAVVTSAAHDTATADALGHLPDLVSKHYHLDDVQDYLDAARKEIIGLRAGLARQGVDLSALDHGHALGPGVGTDVAPEALAGSLDAAATKEAILPGAAPLVPEMAEACAASREVPCWFTSAMELARRHFICSIRGPPCVGKRERACHAQRE